jgi:hypothetical protein
MINVTVCLEGLSDAPAEEGAIVMAKVTGARAASGMVGLGVLVCVLRACLSVRAWWCGCLVCLRACVPLWPV